MKVMMKTRWGAITLVIALVFASGLTLTGCENGPGSGRGFDPVGTWRATHTWHDGHGTVQARLEMTLTLWANGTGTLRQDWFQNNILGYVQTASLTYSVSDNIITFIFFEAGQIFDLYTGLFTDRNTFQFFSEGGVVTFRRS